MEKSIRKTAVLALSMTILSSATAMAAHSRLEYHMAGQRASIQCHTDGKNLWCPSQRGLIMGNDAVADGDWYFLRGQPDAIDAYLDGRSVTIIKGSAPLDRALQVAGESGNKAKTSENLKLTKAEERALAMSDIEEPETAEPVPVRAKSKILKKRKNRRKTASVLQKEIIANSPENTDGSSTQLPVDGPLPVSGLQDKGAWNIRAGEKISDAFFRWASRSGWQIVYDGPDVSSRVDVAMKGTFENAMNDVIEGLNRSGTPIRASFYEQNKVLRITGEGSSF